MTNETKQTAVEWYAIELANYLKDMYGSGIVHVELLTKAKQMEKEQHGKTWDNAIDNLDARGGNVIRAWADFDDFYNEIYGGNK